MRRLGRWLFNLAAIASAVLCAITLAVEVGGGFEDPSPQFRPFLRRWSYLLSGDSRPFGNGLTIQIVLIHHTQAAIRGPILPMGSSPELDAWEKRFPQRFRKQGFGMMLMLGPNSATDASRRVMITGTRIHLILSYWNIELLLLVLPAIAWLPLLRRKPPADPAAIPCLACGYDLRTTPERCPECGEITDHERRSRHRSVENGR